jgi:hypothetical protein
MGLQVMRLYVFSCDHDGCDEWSSEVLPSRPQRNKAAWARKEIAKEGWTFAADGLAFCPEHRRRAA